MAFCLGVALALLGSGCATAPPEIVEIHQRVHADWTPAYIEYEEPGLEGPFTGDCSTFTARVRAVADARGLRTDQCFSWNVGGEPHEWALVEQDGKWWRLDNKWTVPIEVGPERVCR